MDAPLRAGLADAFISLAACILGHCGSLAEGEIGSLELTVLISKRKLNKYL
ncbi:MAG: hypothetical protein RSE46_19735 [Janthinobacterium sp.]|uniref:hypothetical protein n=1 Tax=unclassified Janthinobacterium TaxID=2610881 RepID=UPI0012FDDE02|nr:MULTISPECIES: hypothetical protein [unclassified Janthinobacterium]